MPCTNSGICYIIRFPTRLIVINRRHSINIELKHSSSPLSCFDERLAPMRVALPRKLQIRYPEEFLFLHITHPCRLAFFCSQHSASFPFPPHSGIFDLKMEGDKSVLVYLHSCSIRFSLAPSEIFACRSQVCLKGWSPSLYKGKGRQLKSKNVSNA